MRFKRERMSSRRKGEEYASSFYVYCAEFSLRGSRLALFFHEKDGSRVQK